MSLLTPIMIYNDNMRSDAYKMVFGEDIKDLKSVNAVGSGYIFRWLGVV